jgi:HlyD family secretion protein
VVRISPGQIARLDVDAFKDRKFAGLVTDVANSAKGLGSSSMGMGGGGGGGGSQDATKFEVHIRIKDTENFLPGMSVTAEIETSYRTNVLAVPIASLTTRAPKDDKKNGAGQNGQTNSPATNAPAASGSDKKNKETKPVEVVFVVEGDHVKTVPVKSGISDADYYEITDGLKEEDEVVSGGFRAINRDLNDGHKVVKGPATPATDKKEL